jgi:hypothetical protein
MVLHQRLELGTMCMQATPATSVGTPPLPAWHDQVANLTARVAVLQKTNEDKDAIISKYDEAQCFYRVHPGGAVVMQV